MLSHATSTGSIFPSINAGRAYVGKYCLPVTRQDRPSLHTTHVRDHYPSYTRIQQFETERTFRELEHLLESNSSWPLAATASFGKDKIFPTGIPDAPWTWLINHLSKEHPMILVFKGLSALLRSTKTWHCALYTPVYGRTLRIVKVKRLFIRWNKIPLFPAREIRA